MTLPRKAHAVVFDVDGLIFDTEPLYRDAMISAARAGGYDMKLEVYPSIIGLSVETTRALLSEHFGRRFDFAVFWATASKQYYEMAGSQLYLKAGVVDLLDVLDDLCLPRGIATSSSHEDVRHHLAQHGLLDRFQIIVAQGDYVPGKPNPDPYLKAAERLAVEPALCLALEDSYNGVRAASNARMMTIMVPDLLAATAEMEKLCVCIVQDLHQVRTMIKT
jgi:HAD superfamily hydrolase (TIGR01509 family)